jgi:putative methanogenesis marker protein 8
LFSLPHEESTKRKRTYPLAGKHEIFCCGSHVQISESGVQVLTEPLLEYCPLHESLYGTQRIDAESVQKSVEEKITDWGFCCRNRCFYAESVVAYGASEMMRVWLEKGLMDCAVVACEGAGTVITSSWALVQGIGARLTGIVKTSPIQETIERIKREDSVVLDGKSARIDQVEGVRRAFDLGFKQIAVSVAGFQAKAISAIRDIETNANTNVLIYSVCNTRVDKTDAEHIAQADIACASASKLLRTQIVSKAQLQLGVTIPVYALTENGKRLILAYLAEFDHKLVVFRTSKMPYQTESRGPRFRQNVNTRSII